MSRRRITTGKVLIFLFVTAGAFLIIFPILWITLTSLKTSGEIIRNPPTLIPHQWYLGSYAAVLRAQGLLRDILNSFIISGLSMASILVTSTLGGYAFAKFRFPFRGLVFALVLSTAIVPLEGYMIPVYMTVSRLKLLNTYLGAVFPLLIMSFGIFFLQQFCTSIPDELLHAARVDGASELWILIRIIVPLSRTPLFALGIFSFSDAWGQFIWPLIVINSEAMFTIGLGLERFHKMFYVEHGPIAAGAVIAILPMLLIFLLLRRRFVEGVALSGLTM